MSNNFKVIKDFGNTSKSERRKYLETMMALMGLTSLDELSPEERERWIKACTPQPIVEKKLKEMGYSIHTNDNKRSLGRSRYKKLNNIRKVANVSYAAEEYSEALRVIQKLFDPSVVVEIIGVIDPSLKSKNFDPLATRRSVDLVVENSVDNPEFYSVYIDELLDRANSYNSEFLKSTGTFESFEANLESPSAMPDSLEGSDINIARNHEDRNQVAFVQGVLKGLGYPLPSHGVDGKFGPETEGALIMFQEQNDLDRTGVVTSSVLEALTKNPIPMSEEVAQIYQEEDRELENIRPASSRVDLVNISPILREYLSILNEVAGSFGIKIRITSAFRDSYNQARVMYNNYKARGVGSSRAASYLRSLYVNYNANGSVDEIISIYSSSKNSEDKIKEAKKVIDGWPSSGHRSGYSLDIGLGTKVKDVLIETQGLATVDILDESDHYHVTVKSLKPGGIAKGKIRRFRSSARKA